MNVKLPKGVRLEAVTCEFSQESDSCQSDRTGQDITVQIEDGGGGPYIVIKTERWAVDTPEDIAELCREVLALMPERIEP